MARFVGVFSSPLTNSYGQVLLNDWGSAVKIGKETDFYGARQFAANEVLCKIDAPLAAKPEHDLEMLIKVAYCVTVRQSEYLRQPFLLDNADAKTTCEQAATLWEAVKLKSAWGQLFDAAHKKNYEQLKEGIKKLVPLGPQKP